MFADILMPSEWKKYTSVVTAIILMSVIITPVMHIRKVDIMSGYSEEELAGRGEEIFSDVLKTEFSRKVAEDVRSRIRDEFSLDTSVEVEVVLNDRGSIDKISKITINGSNLNGRVSERIKKIYDVDEVVLNGA